MILAACRSSVRESQQGLVSVTSHQEKGLPMISVMQPLQPDNHSKQWLLGGHANQVGSHYPDKKLKGLCPPHVWRRWLLTLSAHNWAPSSTCKMQNLPCLSQTSCSLLLA